MPVVKWTVLDAVDSHVWRHERKDLQLLDLLLDEVEHYEAIVGHWRTASTFLCCHFTDENDLCCVVLRPALAELLREFVPSASPS